MKKPTKLLVFFLLLGLLGCGSKNDENPEIISDISSCSHCKMLISDTRFSAFIVTDDTFLFDDIGCMISYLNSNNLKSYKLGFMDFEHNTWLKPDSALIIKNSLYSTPMNYGYIAVGIHSKLVSNENTSWSGKWTELQTIVKDE